VDEESKEYNLIPWWLMIAEKLEDLIKG
jgi:hypothetical protein